MKKLINRFKNYMLYAGLSKEEYDDIVVEINADNRKSLMAFSLIATIVLGSLFVTSFIADNTAMNRNIYAGPILFIIIIGIVAKLLTGEKLKYINIDVYCFVMLLFLIGIALDIIVSKDEQTVTFIAFLLTAPLLFADRPIRMNSFIIASMILYIFLASKTKADYVLEVDILDVTVFGIIGMFVSSYMMKVKCQRLHYSKRIVTLSETDILTGLYNRNCYEQSLSEYPDICKKSLACVYVDVNGLHELNNSKGHEAGDKMLKFVGHTMQDILGAEDTYRIGGDEFVSFVADKDEEELLKKIDKLTKLVEEQEYHISVGLQVEKKGDFEMVSLIKQAEVKMYKAKEEYYSRSGMDRRRR